MRFVPYKITGTTSACAENTTTDFPQFAHNVNYLRVRGEYLPLCGNPTTTLELPPRARRIRRDSRCSIGCVGTTSACAENTLNELGLL